MAPKLLIVIGSTREGRVGLPVARWFEARAREHGGFEVEVADLAEIGLPLLDEPQHPRLRDYRHEHTKAWSARVDAADAFAFVSPEYNWGMAPALKNAIDYLNQEWRHKVVGFVTYGGVSAGTRAMVMTRQVIGALELMSPAAAVNIPFVREKIGEDGSLQANDVMEGAAATLLDELARLEAALRPLRNGT